MGKNTRDTSFFEVEELLQLCRSYPLKINVIDRLIGELQEAQGFDLEDRLNQLEIDRLSREKERLTETRDLVVDAVNMLPTHIAQTITTFYLGPKPLSVQETADQLYFVRKTFYQHQRKGIQMLADYLNIKPAIKVKL